MVMRLIDAVDEFKKKKKDKLGETMVDGKRALLEEETERELAGLPPKGLFFFVFEKLKKIINKILNIWKGIFHLQFVP